jgi:hypothetical protein
LSFSRHLFYSSMEDLYYGCNALVWKKEPTIWKQNTPWQLHISPKIYSHLSQDRRFSKIPGYVLDNQDLIHYNIYVYRLQVMDEFAASSVEVLEWRFYFPSSDTDYAVCLVLIQNYNERINGLLQVFSRIPCAQDWPIIKSLSTQKLCPDQEWNLNPRSQCSSCPAKYEPYSVRLLLTALI